MSFDKLVYDWNNIEPTIRAPNRHISFDDETLRDGLQSPSVCEPPVEKKIDLLHLMDAVGIDTADIGLPGAGGTHAAGVERLAREIAEKKLRIRPNCAARTLRNDIVPIVEISQRAGIPIEVCTFIGSSSVRFFAEDWTLEKLLAMTEDAVTFAVSEGMPVMYVTEDTTRADPETIRALYTMAIRCGAKAVCVCDIQRWEWVSGLETHQWISCSSTSNSWDGSTTIYRGWASIARSLPARVAGRFHTITRFLDATPSGQLRGFMRPLLLRATRRVIDD